MNNRIRGVYPPIITIFKEDGSFDEVGQARHVNFLLENGVHGVIPCGSTGEFIAMTIEDSWGGDIITAAIAHLAHSTPERFRFSATDFNSYVDVRTAKGAPVRKNGEMSAGQSPGLGIILNFDSLGPPVARYS